VLRSLFMVVSVVSIGTSAQLACVLPLAPQRGLQMLSHARRRQRCTEHVEVRPFVFPGSCLLVAAPITGGNALAEFARLVSTWVGDAHHLFPADHDTARTASREQLSVAHVLRAFEKATSSLSLPLPSSSSSLSSSSRGHGQAAEGAAGSARNDTQAAASGLSKATPTFTPTFFGERINDPALQHASITGLRAASCCGLVDLYAACCAGVAGVLAQFFPPALLRDLGVSRLVGGGGALTSSTLLRRAVADRFGVPVHTSSRHRGDAALGAAMLTRTALARHHCHRTLSTLRGADAAEGEQEEKRRGGGTAGAAEDGEAEESGALRLPQAVWTAWQRCPLAQQDGASTVPGVVTSATHRRLARCVVGERSAQRRVLAWSMLATAAAAAAAAACGCVVG